jgi:hypothetical protein
MKKLVVLATLIAGFALAQQASACEWMHQAAAKPATVVTCEDGTCTAEQPAQEAATTETAPAATQTAEEPAPAPVSPTLVASGQ